MRVQELKLILKHQAEILSASHASADDVEDLRKFVNFLARFSTLSLDEFCNGYGAKSATAPRKKKAPLSIDEYPRAIAFVTRIRGDANHDVIGELEEDGTVTVPELKAIVAELTGSASGYNSKKKLLQALRSWEYKYNQRETRGTSVEGGF